MNRSAALLLGEILEAIALIESYTSGLTFEEFDASTEKQDAVVRRLAIIGEAVKGLPADLRGRYPDVAWREIAGARDIMIHEYFRLDVGLAWEMVQKNLPELARQVRGIVQAQGVDAEGSL